MALVAMTTMLTAGCLPISQADADHEAAIFADGLLAPRLESELGDLRGESPQRRVQAIHAWLTAPTADFAGSIPGTLWVAGAPDGSTIPVAAYSLWSDTTFVNDERWGRVCREYDVGATLTWRDVACPKGTPREPPNDAVGGPPQ